jgi:hypothetical protein
MEDQEKSGTEPGGSLFRPIIFDRLKIGEVTGC